MSKWLWKNVLVYGRKQSWLEYLGGFIVYCLWLWSGSQV